MKKIRSALSSIIHVLTLICGGVGALLLSIPAQAHPGHGLYSFVAGLVHPLTGLDHLLTALAVGVLGGSLGKKFNLKMCLRLVGGFIFGMLAGMAVGSLGIALPFYEQGISLSLVMLGVCLVSRTRLKPWLAVLLVASFGLVHGNAHGVEVESGRLTFFAATGLILSTGTLHGVGIGTLHALRKMFSEDAVTWILRSFGVGLVGAAFLI